MLKLLVAVQQVEQTEIDRPHVEGSNFRLKKLGWLDAFVDTHEGTAACRYVDRGTGLLLDPGKKATEAVRRLIRATGFFIARMEMEDSGAGFGGAQRLFYNLICRNREVW